MRELQISSEQAHLISDRKHTLCVLHFAFPIMKNGGNSQQNDNFHLEKD